MKAFLNTLCGDNTDALALFTASANGDIVEINDLLKNRSINPSAKNNKALYIAAEKGHIDIIHRLLQEPRIFPSHKQYREIMRLAQTNGHFEVSQILMRYQNISTPLKKNHYNMLTAIVEGNLNSVNILLQCKDFHPGYNRNFAILIAALFDDLAIINQLLTDSRTNPSDRNNAAIIMAATMGHLQIVNRLLQDHRVNPTAKEHRAIREATKEGHINIVYALANWYKKYHINPENADDVKNILNNPDLATQPPNMTFMFSDMSPKTKKATILEIAKQKDLLKIHL